VTDERFDAQSGIPDGLTRCPVCGELRGRAMFPDPPDGATSSEATASCLCDGLVCGACDRGHIHRPISNYYDEASGKLIHVPYFMGLRRCPECDATDWQPVGRTVVDRG
jgi:hypothetical protein